MDRFQEMAVMGFDGPDSFSPKAEIKAEIARLESGETGPMIKSRLASLRQMLLEATDKGGFRPAPT